MICRHNSGLPYGNVLLGIAILLILFIISAYVYLRFGPVPVAVGDPAFPFEKPIVRIAVRARTARENQNPPFAVSENVFESGVRTYPSIKYWTCPNRISPLNRSHSSRADLQRGYAKGFQATEVRLSIPKDRPAFTSDNHDVILF
jgi:hypothetical protein